MNVSKTPNINLFHGDGEAAINLARCKDYDLAIVDVPYGIGEGSEKIKSRHHSQAKYKTSNWDKEAPKAIYFNNLRKVTKNQIVWGANHFISRFAADSSCWIVWDKDTGQCDFADCELAWTSFHSAVKLFKFTWNGFRQGYVHANKEDRVHPTQKPVALYKWLLQNYAKPGDKILDTHGGSMSIAIAAYDLGYDLDLWEIDEDYYKAGVERVKNHIKQGQLFNPAQIKKEEPKQLSIDG